MSVVLLTVHTVLAHLAVLLYSVVDLSSHQFLLRTSHNCFMNRIESVMN